MAERLIETIKRISTPPADSAAFDEWLSATDGIDFLKGNIEDDEFVFYATPGSTFIHSLLVPAANVNPPDIKDLMAWSFNAYGTWGRQLYVDGFASDLVRRAVQEQRYEIIRRRDATNFSTRFRGSRRRQTLLGDPPAVCARVRPAFP